MKGGMSEFLDTKEKLMKSHTRVVVIVACGMGVGLLYHLAKEGWNDVMLIEKGELTSGSTWHATGLEPNFFGSLNRTQSNHRTRCCVIFR